MENKNIFFTWKNIPTKRFKDRGFKSKESALEFLNFLDKNVKDFNNSPQLLNFLENKRKQFLNIGVDIVKTGEIIKKSERQTKKINKLIKQTTHQILKVDVLYNKKKYHKVKQLNLDEFSFNYHPQGEDILNVANKFYQNVKFEIPKNYDYLNIKNDRKKTFNYAFSDDDLQLENLLFSVYHNQKHTFKINISFGFTLIRERNTLLVLDEKNPEYNVRFKLYHATPNTRITSHPTTIDNKKDVDKLIKRIRTENLMHRLYDMVPNSSWHFYEYLYIRFDVYQMTTAIGKAHELPSHFTTGSNEKALVHFDGDQYKDCLCFWRCLTVHIINSERKKK